MSKTDRRTFLAKAGLLSLTAFSGAALLQACGGGATEEAASSSPKPAPAPSSAAATPSSATTCDELNANLTESDLSVRESIGYVAESPEADKICKNCRFYQPDKFEGSCGGCQLFVNGAVSPAGYCKSWAATEA